MTRVQEIKRLQSDVAMLVGVLANVARNGKDKPLSGEMLAEVDAAMDTMFEAHGYTTVMNWAMHTPYRV